MNRLLQRFVVDSNGPAPPPASAPGGGGGVDWATQRAQEAAAPRSQGSGMPAPPRGFDDVPLSSKSTGAMYDTVDLFDDAKTKSGGFPPAPPLTEATAQPQHQQPHQHQDQPQPVQESTLPSADAIFQTPAEHGPGNDHAAQGHAYDPFAAQQHGQEGYAYYQQQQQHQYQQQQQQPYHHEPYDHRQQHFGYEQRQQDYDYDSTQQQQHYGYDYASESYSYYDQHHSYAPTATEGGNGDASADSFFQSNDSGSHNSSGPFESSKDPFASGASDHGAAIATPAPAVAAAAAADVLWAPQVAASPVQVQDFFSAAAPAEPFPMAPRSPSPSSTSDASALFTSMPMPADGSEAATLSPTSASTTANDSLFSSPEATSPRQVAITTAAAPDTPPPMPPPAPPTATTPTTPMAPPPTPRTSLTTTTATATTATATELTPSPSASSRATSSSAEDSRRLAEMYKQMAERLEQEKSDLLKVIADQAAQCYQMQDYIHELEREVGELRSKELTEP